MSKNTALILFLVALLSLPFGARADSSAMLTSVDGTTQAAKLGSEPHLESVTRASGVVSERSARLPISVSDLSMILGPSFDSMSTNAPSSAHPYSGIGTRHLVRVEYALSPDVSIAPILDVTDNFYDSRQGRLIFNDPSLRMMVRNVSSASFGRARLRSAIWISGFAPTSAVSQSLHQYGAFALAYVSKVDFRGSRFFLTGIGQAKGSVLENQSQTGTILPAQLVTALEADYRASPKLTYFLMDHFNANLGPNTALVATPIASENYRKRLVASQTVFDCLMVGVHYKVTRDVDLSPRLDWLVNLPVSETAVGLNASFHLI